MRTFIQSVAGGTFIKGEYMTFVVRKDHAEYIFKLRNSLYGIINFLINGEDEVILLADWGFFFRRVTNHADSEQLMRMLEKHCPKVVKLFSEEFDNSDYSVVTLTSGDNNVMGIRKKIPANCARPLIEIMGEHSIVEEAGKLLDYSLDIYREIQDHCPFPGWKRGLKEEVYIVK